MTRGGVMTFAMAAVLASLQLAGSCVDGVTPDCSIPSVCAPSEGDAASSTDSAALEASSDTGSSDTGAPADAAADAISDAADADGG